MMKSPNILLVLISGLAAATASAQFNLTTLHDFGESSLIGQVAKPLARGPDGTMYGVTEFGGAGSGGVLYRLSADGSTRTILHEFGSVTNGGTRPDRAVLPASNGFLYGVTKRGSTNSQSLEGIIYRVGTNGAGYTLLRHLPSFGDGWQLIEASNGRIYGLTGAGLIGFDADGGNFSMLFTNVFTETDSLFEGQDGMLYMVEGSDSIDVTDGALYRINKDGSNLTVLRSRIPFRGSIANVSPFPCCAFQSTDGFIYGMEDVGGDSYFFRTDTNVATSAAGWDERGTLNLLGFQHLPTAFFQASDGKFYGSFSRPYVFAPQGYLFRWDSFDTISTTRTNLVDWPASVVGPFGGTPAKSFLEGSDGRFYGVVDGGGRHGAGLIFRVDKDGTGFTHLFEFFENDGLNAAPPIILSSDGLLYGTTREGGVQDLGTIYCVRPDGSGYNMIRQFFTRDEGADPAGGIIDGGDGFLYGATASGGSQNLGTIFKLRYDGSEFAVIYNIRSNRPAATPQDPSSITGSLVMDTNGWLYGVGTTGGSAGRGGVFRAHKDGTLFTNIHNFIVGEARRPVGGLILALDGKLYGTTENGGANDAGVLYQIDPNGSGFQILKVFGGTNDGANPSAPLWQAANGILFGTTFGGGSNNVGSVFSYNPANSNFAVLHHFGDSSDGRRPSAGLVEAADGSLIGATRFGGSGPAGQQLGTIFKLNKDGSGYEVLRSFTGAGGDGESVFSTLARGAGDIFYGTTSLGGNDGSGTMFTFSLGGTMLPLVLAPTNTTLRGGQTRTFAASGGTPPYSFSFAQSNSGGTIDPATGSYTAGATDTVLDTVRVTDSAAASVLATIAVAPLSLLVTAATPQEFLDHLTHLEGHLILDDVDARLSLLLPMLTNVVGDLIIRNDDQLQSLNLGALEAVGGNFVVTNNRSLTNVTVGALANVTGAVNISDNDGATVVDLSSLGTVGNNVTIVGNDAATVIDLSDLDSVAGGIEVSDNVKATLIDLSSLGSVGGDFTIINNEGAIVIDLNALATVAGGLEVSGNDAVSVIDLASLGSVGNHVTIVGNGSANVINISNLVSVAGVINVRDNNAATVVDLASVRSIGGDVIIVGNGAAIVIDLRQVGSVGGDLTISSNAPSATTDLSSLTTVGGGTNTATVLLQQGAFVFTNGFTVPTNATLAGHGTLAGSVTNSGTISPGASPGRFQLTGNLILAPNSQLRFELAGSAPAQADFLSVAGGVTLGGTLSVTLINSAPVSLVDGASFTLITAGSAINGAFANVPSGGALTTADGFARFTAQYAGQTSVQLAGLVSLDTDGDSLSNAREQAAGTDPANPLSVFRILSLVSEPGGVRLTWSTVGGRSYVVQTNDRLTGPFADFGLPIAVPGAGESTTNLLDAAALPGVSRFYRVRLGP